MACVRRPSGYADRDIFTPLPGSIWRIQIDPQNAKFPACLEKRWEVRLQVNGIYPDAVAETTFPSTLLQKLPTLPDELAYRIMGRDLVLVDSKANLVVDLFHEALP
jgi:hypothetical protein